MGKKHRSHGLTTEAYPAAGLWGQIKVRAGAGGLLSRLHSLELALHFHHCGLVLCVWVPKSPPHKFAVNSGNPLLNSLITPSIIPMQLPSAGPGERVGQ